MLFSCFLWYHLTAIVMLINVLKVVIHGLKMSHKHYSDRNVFVNIHLSIFRPTITHCTIL